MTDALEQIEDNALTEREREHYQQIVDGEERCRQLEDEYETDKATAATSKKRWEQAVANNRALIRQGPDCQKTLDFPDDWRTVLITEVLTLTERQSELLDEIGVKTVEQFEDLRASKHKDYPRGLLDLPRIGESTVDKWEDEIVEWMAGNATEPESDDGEDAPEEG